MFNFNYVTKKNIKKITEIGHKLLQNINSWWFWIWKKNSLLNLINNESDFDKIYWYAKDPYEAKYQLLISKRESTDLKYLNNVKAFLEYSNDMDDFYKKIEEYNPNKKRKILILFDNLLICLKMKILIQ